MPEIPQVLLDEAIAEHPELKEILDELGLRSMMIVPISARGRMLGAISFFWAESGRRYSEADLELAVDLARRAGIAVDNAQLYRAAEERSQAARVLASIGDGVMLVDGKGIVRYWNRAAEAITGLPAPRCSTGRPPTQSRVGALPRSVCRSRSIPSRRREPSRCRSAPASPSSGCRSPALQLSTARSTRFAT